MAATQICSQCDFPFWRLTRERHLDYLWVDGPLNTILYSWSYGWAAYIQSVTMQDMGNDAFLALLHLYGDLSFLLAIQAHFPLSNAVTTFCF
ncbi:uncharacterized protein BDW70DRAFT_141326 [Aspergillus foveolatus]|uniref:uncharacterized protein n=1 Tax=Aspergillus foveolatus TaxID=210207 RepID=UPI003CCD1C9E